MTLFQNNSIRDKVKIIVKGEDKTDSVRTWSQNGGKVHITYSSGRTYSYSKANVLIKRSALSSNRAFNCFEYLKRIADAVGLHDSRVGNILANHYEKIEFLSEKDNMLTAFLTGKIETTAQITHNVDALYPFGFNMSQRMAIGKALANPLTIIEGPPGTGKTQTILNIIANAVMRNETVAIVSGNNSATANVFEKLNKYKVGFIAAQLGSLENKQEFINSQQPLPDLSGWGISWEKKKNIKKSLQSLHETLLQMLSKKNELSKIKQELDAVELEFKHFEECCDYNDGGMVKYLKSASSDSALQLWLLCEKYIQRKKMPNLFGRLINRFRYGVMNRGFYSLSPGDMIALCQRCYYMMKIAELRVATSRLQEELFRFNFDKKMGEYSELSATLFRGGLADKYPNTKRQRFKLPDLYQNPEGVTEEYPVILATTYSLRSSLLPGVMYDYVIVDEASQVDLATGALALSCAKKVVIVGDLKQLPNVVDSDAAHRSDAIFEEFNLPEAYRYKNHSLLSAILEIFPNAPRTLLREHYRCHPKIIGFCNQKFYGGQLIILTESEAERSPLIVYKTAPGNHAREHVNQRQIDVIKNEIIPMQNLKDCKSLGIVTPYRNQTNALQKAFSGTGIQADTVDKFQGRENDVIILSTVDNEISRFADNSNRLNVAISRAVKQLVVVINGGDDRRDTNIGDLVRYIEYNNFEIVRSEIYSVFDFLYKGLQKKREEFLLRYGQKSEYASENLMYGLIRDVLRAEHFMRFDVVMHVPVRMIFRSLSRLDDTERRYAGNILTHVDFLIFDRCGKTPRLAIEVDGVSFHAEGSRQSERDKLKDKIFEKYDLPLERFRTNESGERERLVSILGGMIEPG